MLLRHLQTFLARAHERGPRFVRRELCAYLDCGILANGFARVHGSSCGRDELVAFSCKGRGFCPSCCGRRMAETAVHPRRKLCPSAPYAPGGEGESPETVWGAASARTTLHLAPHEESVMHALEFPGRVALPVLVLLAAKASAQCELARFDGLPDLSFAPDVVLDGDTALVSGWIGDVAQVQALARDDGGTPDVPADDVWQLADVFVPGFHFTGRMALGGELLLARGPGELEGEGEVFVLLRRPGGWLELDHLRPSEPGWRDGFGSALAVRGSTFLIGSVTDSLGLQYRGSAGFYERDEQGTRSPLDDRWVESARVVGLPVERSSFGGVVALHDDLAAVTGGTDSFGGPRVVFLYARRPDDRWVQSALFGSPLPFDGDGFGARLALTRDFLFVSAPQADEGLGAVYVHARRERGDPSDLADDLWVPLAPILAPAPEPGSFHGGALAASDDRLLVGWPALDEAGEDAGSARLYRRLDLGVRGDPSDDAWELQAVLRPSDAGPGQHFGERVALQENSALVTSLGRLHVFTGKCTAGQPLRGPLRLDGWR